MQNAISDSTHQRAGAGCYGTVLAEPMIHLQKLRPFAVELVEGTTSHLEVIDELLQNTSKNWKLHRMPVVDLSILRCAAYEILYLSDIDPATSIMRRLKSRKFTVLQISPKFINGVLDNIQKK